MSTFGSWTSKSAFFMLVFKKEMMDMAVRVIRYGDKRRTMCAYSSSLLEYEKEDVKTVQTGMNEWEGEIICPNCRERVRVKG